MRVIAGIAKGRKLKAPKGRAIRPTSDRVREAIFSILGARAVGAAVLDLYAGTGALGIEALSRGAGTAVFVDERREAVSLADENLTAVGLRVKGRIIRGKVEYVVERLSREQAHFDLIFIDPPYRISVTELSDICQKVLKDILAVDGLMVLEHSSKLKPPVISGSGVLSSKTYGDTAVTVYRKEGKNDDGDLPGKL